MRRRTTAVAAAAALAAAGLAGAATVAAPAGTGRSTPAATAVALEITAPGGATLRLARGIPGRPLTQALQLAEPADGSLARIDAAAAVATTGPDAVGGAVVLTGVRLLGGEVTAAAVTVHETHGSASAAGAPARGPVLAVRELSLLGARVDATPGARYAVGDWAVLEVGARETSGRPGGTRPLVALRLRLVTEHRGVPAGTVVSIGVVGATGSPPPARVPAARTAARVTARVVAVSAAGARVTPGGHAFPLARRTPVTDTFGARRAGVGWHHGVDLFGPRGTAVLAVADGTLFEVGWNSRGGNRLWLRDGHGNAYYYAHLDAYATGVRDGALVRAGQALGTLGRSGDAEHTPPHLHFEAHPAEVAAVGYDGAVNPTRSLRAWARGSDSVGLMATLSVPALRAVAARPAAFLLEADVAGTTGPAAATAGDAP